MPTYDYECENCIKVFEIFQQMSDEPIKKCPDCENPVKRLIGGGLGVIFKGSGFYINDSKKSSKSTSNSSSESSPSTSDKTSTKTKKSDTKSA